MNMQKLAVMGGVAALALAAALWSTSTRTPVQDSGGAQLLVTGLEAKLNEVSTVRVRAAGDQVLTTLVRNEDGWQVQERDGYPADVSKLRDYLLKLAQAKRVEKKTANPELYYKLGVDAMTVPDAFGTQLELDGITPPLRLILGHNVPRGSGTYVRFADQPEGWEAGADLAVERLPANWLVKDLIDVQPAQIAKIDVTPSEGPAIHVLRGENSAGGEFALATVPKGRKPASEFAADGIAGFLSGLKLDDVLPAAQAAQPAKTQVAVFTQVDGQVLTVTSWQADGKTFARFALANDDAVLKARFEDRVFVLPPYKADTLHKPLEGYLEPQA